MGRAQVRRGRRHSGGLPVQVRLDVVADDQQRFHECLLLRVVVWRHSAVAVIAVSAGRSSVISGDPVRRHRRDIVPREAVVLDLVQFCGLRIALDVRHT